MKTNTLLKRGKQPAPIQPQRVLRRPVSRQLVLSDPQGLQHAYTAAIQHLGPDLGTIDAWLADHQPDLWQQIRWEDDELFRLRKLGVRERVYRTALEAFVSLYQEAERLYYEAHPNALTLPMLGEGESVAIYYELTDGSLHKVSGTGED